MGGIISHANHSKKKNNEELTYANCKLTKIPNSLYSWSSSLKKLDLSRNRLCGLHSQFKNLRVLEALNLAVNFFIDVPQELILLECLKELDISFNQLTVISKDIALLRNLRVLILKTNKICQVAPEIGNLEHLEQLRLENNFLDHLPENMGKLHNLKILNIACNELDRLPNCFEEWSHKGKLEELIVFGNAITELPSYICKFTQLTVLSVARNELHSLPQEFFTSLEKLTRLALGANHLSSPLAPVIRLPSLTEFDLRGNHFESLPDIRALTSLRIMDVSFNPLSSLPLEYIQPLTSLQLIKVHTSQIVDNSKGNDNEPRDE